MGGGDGAVSIKLTTDEKNSKSITEHHTFTGSAHCAEPVVFSVLLKNKITSLSLPRIE